MRLLVNFSKKKGTAPIIAQAVKDTGVLINVERAVIDSSEGEALIEVPDDQCKLIRKHDDPARRNRSGSSNTGSAVDQSECVDCGACISVCPREVFSFDADFKLVVAEDKCVLCGKCIPPARTRRSRSLYDPRAVPVPRDLCGNPRGRTCPYRSGKDRHDGSPSGNRGLYRPRSLFSRAHSFPTNRIRTSR